MKQAISSDWQEIHTAQDDPELKITTSFSLLLGAISFETETLTQLPKCHWNGWQIRLPDKHLYTLQEIS